ncbi:CHASE domain-containing protein [Colwellia piezophila]|uniref:CHASE domain-containing protein n=1 Tax=Colwellia piezophila TaxID=211668 RepID=UPI000370A376|nr:CHASE domain-containing protein [Colwellia piezophila]
MIQPHLARFFISAIIYIAIFFGTTWLIEPQSVVSFVGPTAAIASGLILMWGITPLIALLLVSPFLAYSLGSYFQLEVDLAVMTIAILAIILQGFWTKQLVFSFIHNKTWLISRKYLFFFLLRIGPIASLVSASAALVLAMLDNQVMQGTFFYTFINTWSASMLVAVFFIPLLLLVKNAEQLKLTKRLFVGCTSVLGVFAILLLLQTAQYEQQHARQVKFEQSKIEIQRLILAEISAVVNQINSLSAFFKASNNISLAEFNIFSENTFKTPSSVRALEWAPIVPFAQRKKFEQRGSKVLQQKFQIKERLMNGEMALAGPRNQYAPLYYIYPKYGNQAALGLDVYSNPKHVLPMQEVVDSQQVIASAPITLVQDNTAKAGILFSYAVFVPSGSSGANQYVAENKITPTKKEKLLGFVVVVVQLDRFLQHLATEDVKDVNVFIQDITNSEPSILFGQAIPKVNRYSQTISFPVFSRVWQVTMAEKEPWFSQPKSWQAWAVIIGVTLGAVLFQMLVLMMAAYSSELSQQVDSKTRALILAKEISEKKNIAKSYFLQTLNKELRLPLLAIKAFVEQLQNKGMNNKEVMGIGHAGSNVTLLLDTMMDLSDIEAGKVVAKEDCFDFYGFLQRIELVLKASNAYEDKSVFFLTDDSVPHYLNSDELYIQKLLHALIESAHDLLKTNALRLAIKLHKHQDSGASLFFTLLPQNIVITNQYSQGDPQQASNEFIANSTAMAMAIKYSQLLGGNTSFATLSSGTGVLNASIRVSISSIEQQEVQQGLIFDIVD